MKESPGLLAKIGIKEPESVFEVPTLSLEMMWTEVHPFRPDDPRQELHNRDTVGVS
jgi:hypothetical protein